MLIQNLRELERDAVVTRNDFHEVPPRVEYALTRFGASLMRALRPLCEWGARHMNRIEALKAQAGEAAGRNRRPWAGSRNSAEGEDRDDFGTDQGFARAKSLATARPLACSRHCHRSPGSRWRAACADRTPRRPG